MTKYKIYNQQFHKIGSFELACPNNSIRIAMGEKKSELQKELDQVITKFFKKNGLKIVSPHYSNTKHNNGLTVAKNTKNKRFTVHIIKSDRRHKTNNFQILSKAEE